MLRKFQKVSLGPGKLQLVTLYSFSLVSVLSSCKFTSPMTDRSQRRRQRRRNRNNNNNNRNYNNNSNYNNNYNDNYNNYNNNNYYNDSYNNDYNSYDNYNNNYNNYNNNYNSNNRNYYNQNNRNNSHYYSQQNRGYKTYNNNNRNNMNNQNNNENMNTQTEYKTMDNPSNSSNIIEIDGSYLEGGGQILRNCVSLAALLNKPIHVTKIRAGRSTPGLRPQHLHGINLIQKIYGGKLEGNYVKSTQLYYYPSDISNSSKNTTFVVDTQTAGSVCLLLQIALPVLIYYPYNTTLILRGGTNAAFAPQIDYITLVLKPMLELLYKKSFKFNVKINRRGWYPHGGGEIVVDITPLELNTKLNSFSLLNRGIINNINGICLLSKLDKSIGNNIIQGCYDTLKNYIKKQNNNKNKLFDKNTKINIDLSRQDTRSQASGLVIAAYTDKNNIFGSSNLGDYKKNNRNNRNNRNNKDYNMGVECANDLINDIIGNSLNGSVDKHLQDQLIIFMALSNGKSIMKCGKLELHTETAIHFVSLMTGAKFNVIKQNNNNNIDSPVKIECEGIGFDLSKRKS